MRNTHICFYTNNCKNGNLCNHIHDFKLIQLCNLYKSVQDCFNKIVNKPISNKVINFTNYLNNFEVLLWNIRSGCEYKKKSNWYNSN